MRVLGVVPARLGSTRLPNKPLQLLAGEPLLARVLAQARAHELLDEIVVATDSAEVAAVAQRAGVRAVMTRASHRSGTDRVAEVADLPAFETYETIANVQGDEPFLPRTALAGALAMVDAGYDVGTASAPLDAGLAADPTRVKVVTDRHGRALYFSRSLIPFVRDDHHSATGLYWQHLGVYVYRREALSRWVAEPPAQAELAEQLEQLRALHIGLTLGVARLPVEAPPGIDTAADLVWAERHWRQLRAHQRSHETHQPALQG